MGIGWRSALGAALWLACASAHAQAPAGPPPVEAYGRLPVVQDAAISPDGTRLVLSIANANDTALRLYNLATRTVETTLAAPPENKFRGVGWADDTHAIYYLSRTLRGHQALPQGYRFAAGVHQVEYWRTGVFNVNTKRGTLMMDDERAFARTNLMALTAPIAGDEGFARMIAYAGVGVGNLVEDTPQLAVYRVSLDRGFGTAQTVGDRDTRDFLLNESGRAVARLDVDNESGAWKLLAYEPDGRRTRVLREGTTQIGDPPTLLALMPDGRFVVVGLSDETSDVFVTLDPNTGETQPLRGPGGEGPGGVLLDPWTHVVLGIGWTDDLPRQVYFDQALQARSQALAERFADGYFNIRSWSADKSKLLIYAESSTDGGCYYVLDGNALTRVTCRYPELTNEAALGLRQSITYRARDGTRIPAYLTLPAGVEARNLPLVLLVHGGPHSRDTFEFDWWASFLASRGYAVVQPNFRGSTGYGQEWYRAGHGQWGDGLMQTDVEDAVASLARAGMVDGARVCIVGASYGGYSALAGAALTPERYACAASVGGVTDLLDKLDSTAKRGGSRGLASDWWRTSIGDRREDREHLRAISPINRVESVRAPVLLMHGQDDTVVPITQSRRMHERLRGAGKNVRFVELRGDDHWLSEAETRIQMLRELETFLAANLGAGAQ